MKRTFIIIFALLGLEPVVVPQLAEAQQVIRINEPDAAERRIPLRFVDATDNETAETGVSISGAECQISENGASPGNCAGTVTEIADGNYYYTAGTGEVDTAGFYSIIIDDGTVDHNDVVAWYQVQAKLTAADVQFRGVTTCEGTGCTACASETAAYIGLASGDVDADNQYVGMALNLYDTSGLIYASSCIDASENGCDSVRLTDSAASLHTNGDSYEIITSEACRANVSKWAATAVATPDTAGYPVVTVKDGTSAGEINTNAGAVVSVTTADTCTALTTNNDKTGYALSGTQTFNVTGNITGNVSGSVGSVTGNVGGNVVGSVGSVSGAVGSVTGNVGGNVVGSVGSVTAAVTPALDSATGTLAASQFESDFLTAAKVASDVGTELGNAARDATLGATASSFNSAGTIGEAINDAAAGGGGGGSSGPRVD